MAGAATLTINNNPIGQAPVRMTLTLTNTSGSDVTITSISPSVSPPSNCFSISPPSFAPGSNVTVAGSNGTLAIPIQGIFYTPVTPGLPSATGQSTFYVSFDCKYSDGSVFSCPAVNIATAPGTELPQTTGSLKFDDARNSALFLLLM